MPAKSKKQYLARRGFGSEEDKTDGNENPRKQQRQQRRNAARVAAATPLSETDPSATVLSFDGSSDVEGEGRSQEMGCCKCENVIVDGD